MCKCSQKPNENHNETLDKNFKPTYINTSGDKKYNILCDNSTIDTTTIRMCEKNTNKMSKSVCLDCSNTENNNNNYSRSRLSILSPPRQRKTGVFNCNYSENNIDNTVTKFPSVDELIKMYASIIKRNDDEVRQLTSNNLNSSNSVDSNKMGKPNDEDVEEPELLTDVINMNLKCSKDSEKTVHSADNLTANKITSADIIKSDELRRSKLNQSPASDDGWCAQQSPYCSSDEEDGKFKVRDKVTRSSSSDSALGLEEDIAQTALQMSRKTRRMTLTVCDIPLRPALLPLAEPSSLQGSCEVLPLSAEACPQLVRSRMLLEAQVIEIPVTQDVQDIGFPNAHTSVSRRESSQSYLSDSGEERIRYVRTPSVVVSDYSDDILCGITLEEIEYFRKHRLRRGSTEPEFESDVSAASSCSNLNYCGSTLSALEGCDYQFGLRTPERKTSDCSTCSTASGDEEETSITSRSAENPPQPKKKVSSKTKCSKCLHAAAISESDIKHN